MATATKKRTTFSPPALVWNPLPHMQEYLDELEARDVTPGYRRIVRNGLAHFAQAMQDQGITDPSEIERVHLIRFQAVVNNNPDWKPSYRQKIMHYSRAWISWCVSLNYIHQDPWVKIKVGSTPKKPKPIEDDELELLFMTHRQGAFTMSPFAFHRREMILCLLYGWGLRVHELAALNVANMDSNNDYVTCINKGGGTKQLPYTDEMKKVFNRYVTTRGKQGVAGEDALIITSNGRRMPPQSIARIVTDLADKAALKINPHRLRDTCGTHLLDSDVPVERVAKILGHVTNSKMTLAYARVNDHKVKESHEQAMDPRLRGFFSSTRGLRPSGN